MRVNARVAARRTLATARRNTIPISGSETALEFFWNGMAAIARDNHPPFCEAEEGGCFFGFLNTRVHIAVYIMTEIDFCLTDT